ncbi:Glu-tRNA(Gln) amidotransferase subunit GatE [Candidatus Pacearchaeota archaeon]|nr:Glu-tRNA(Gln) amidotransferase subunit GatE [Candidatus Pacearchaeota archaeon]MBI2057118.1 Glu-tRNA(Gln) amidotransferase subunit GatE [Candidatus Pacearchaeota archaeon]
MSEKELDYEKLKFKSGLEIHQQLDTKKLFCKCPSILRSNEPDLIINRKLHAVAGEKGEVDIAAQYQSSLKKEFIYEFYKNNNCLIELDEEPPKIIDQEALKIALQISLLLNCKIIPITQIMRKIVIDGSNTSGFQRTVLIARDGFIETKYGRVKIDTICLEEDSARKISEDNGKITYRLDRLGIPLIEIATAPDIKSPEQAKETALHIGEILRSCKVKRGIGTIRQDVNVSIRNENRVELKGVQDMKIFVKIVENEIKRQLKLSDEGKPAKSEVRNALPSGLTEFIRPMPGADRMYPETDLPLLKISRELINEIKKELPKLKSEIEGELNKTGLSQEMIKLLLAQNKVDEFRNLLNIYKNPNFIAKMILLFPKEISAKTGKSFENVESALEEIYGDVLIALNKNKISESNVKEILAKFAKGEKFENAIKIEKTDAGEIEEKIMKLIKEKPGLSKNAYMGLVMTEMKGKIDGKTANEIINKFVK